MKKHYQDNGMQMSICGISSSGFTDIKSMVTCGMCRDILIRRRLGQKRKVQGATGYYGHII